MKTVDMKLYQAYDRLINYFFSGVLALVILNAIRQEYKGKVETANDLFIFASIISTFNTAVLVMANTIKPHNDSIHLPYLINLMKNSQNCFDAEVYKKLTSFIREFEEELSKISGTIDLIIELRDTTVAHVDRKHVNDPSSLLQKPPIAWDDMIAAYDLVASGLVEMGTYLGLKNISDYLTFGTFALKINAARIFRSLQS